MRHRLIIVMDVESDASIETMRQALQEEMSAWLLPLGPYDWCNSHDVLMHVEAVYV